MTGVFQIADRHVEEAAALDPHLATYIGVPGQEEELTDHSPDGVEARMALRRRTAAELREAVPAGDAERVCRDFMLERLQAELDLHQAGESWRCLRVFATPVQTVRQSFDLAPRETEEDWSHIAARMRRVPASLAGFRQTLAEGLRRGLPAARRQALVCADQAATIGGVGGRSAPYFVHLASLCPFPGLAPALERGSRDATRAYAELGDYLRRDYAPASPDRDPVGPERHRLWAREYLGSDIDPQATYAWGWEELRRLEAEMRRVAGLISPGASVAEAVHLLRTDPSRAITGADRLIAFLQELTDRAIGALNGVHFDIPEPIRRVECVLAPEGTAAAMYYTPPSEDFRRPGRTWYPTLGRTVFPLWVEVSTAYHEGVPGHHLQVGLARCLTDRLSRYQRLMGWVSGYGEGWALYAERLMQELGYLDNPDHEMGMLQGQAFRAMRVVVDIGLHHQLAVPSGEAGAGEPWSWGPAVAFADRYTPHPGDFTRSEVERYLGLPAQAISYKVGERAWLAIRDEVRAREGAAFDLKAFHTRALGLGAVGLDQLRRELGGR